MALSMNEKLFVISVIIVLALGYIYYIFKTIFAEKLYIVTPKKDQPFITESDQRPRQITEKNIEHEDRNDSRDVEDPMIYELKRRMLLLFTHPFQFPPILSDFTREYLIGLVVKENKKESYAIDKKVIYMCLRDKNGEYYHVNHLLYVFAHEIAHCLCDSTGHTEEWKTLFEALLKEMTSKGIYNPAIDMPNEYCGIKKNN